MKNVLLIGIGNFGSLIAKQLSELGHQTMAIDKNETCINEIMPYVTNAQIGDSTNESFLRTLGVGNYDVCIVAIGSDFQSSLETTSLLKELGAKMVVARADREVQAKFLLRNGADDVVNPAKQMAKWTAIRYTANHILDYIMLDDSHAIFEVTVPKEWVGKTVKNLDVRKKYGVNIMAIKENGKLQLYVSPDEILTEGKTMLVLGEYKAIQKCFRL